MPTYAANTEVPADRSRQEIERTLKRYGATSFMYGWEESKAVVAFTYAGRTIRFELPMPDRNSREFTHTPSKGLKRSEKQQREAYEQATKQRWRALAIVVKAKLEAVEAGIASFEEEFLAYFVLPDGRTVGSEVLPRLEQAYVDGGAPALLR